MPNLPRPKVLPKVNYAPPQNAPDTMQAQGGIGIQNPYGEMGAAEAWDNQRAQAMGQLQATGGAEAGAPVTVSYQPQTQVAGNTTQSPNTSPSNPLADRRYDALEESRMRQMAASNSQTDTARIQDAVNKNRANTQAAQAAGDNVNLARLNAEWERLTQSPLYQQMYGGSNEQAMKQRLVNVYMKPGNPAAANDLAGAMSAAVADDVWAREATKAFGRPPNQLEWDEHWKAMNVGGRDPLAGHPQSIQNIQNTMNQFQQQNQNTSYNDYSNWAGGH